MQVMSRRHATVLSVAALAVALVGCGEDVPGGGPTTTTEGATTTFDGGTTTTIDGGTTNPPTTPPTTTPPPTTTIPEVTTTVLGTAVGGNAGGEGRGATDSNSELIRNEDGSCSGWELSSTAGLDNGAPVVFLDRESRNPIGEGQVTTSAWEDVDPGDREQWNCTFVIQGEVSGTPSEFYVSIAGLPPWVARPDPTNPGQFVVSVDSQASVTAVPACTDTTASFTFVDEWSAVGLYWSRGLERICNAGLTIAMIERTCRPLGFASEHIVRVTRADDPGVVLEDPGGLQPAAEDLTPGTPVIPHVTTGRPCG